MPRSKKQAPLIKENTLWQEEYIPETGQSGQAAFVRTKLPSSTAAQKKLYASQIKAFKAELARIQEDQRVQKRWQTMMRRRKQEAQSQREQKERRAHERRMLDEYASTPDFAARSRAEAQARKWRMARLSAVDSAMSDLGMPALANDSLAYNDAWVSRLDDILEANGLLSIDDRM
jgi:hypothetical protein